MSTENFDAAYKDGYYDIPEDFYACYERDLNEQYCPQDEQVFPGTRALNAWMSLRSRRMRMQKHQLKNILNRQVK